MSKRLLYIFLGIGLVWLLNSCGKDKPTDPNPPTPPTQPGEGNGDNEGDNNTAKYPAKEIRGVWMATVFELDWPMGKHDVASQKKLYTDYLDLFKSMNFNTVYVQIKSIADAFYDSPYEPWSKSITGTLGQDPGYDVLKFMIDEAHERGLEFHAWMNPFRMATRADGSQQYPPIPASVDPSWVVSHEKVRIYNPAIPEVRQRLSDIVKDVITKYNVDGIHFDDYFYPDPASAGTMISDQADFEKYGAGFSDIKDFRRDNINKAIEAVHDVIVANRPDVVFSISPASDPNYSKNTLYADITNFTKQGWIDVLIPQLYHEIGHPTADYQMRLSYWAQYKYDAVLAVGHALYKFGDATYPAFMSTTELQKQIEMSRRDSRVSGSVMYRAQDLVTNRINIADKLRDLYKNPALVPFAGREVAAAPQQPTNVKISNGKLIWNVTGNNVRSVVYYFASPTEEGKILSVTDKNEWPVSELGNYSVSTLNPDNKESKPSDLVQLK